MKHIPMNLRDRLIIKDIVTVHYLEFSKNYEFLGEKHDFWEFVYVDRGTVCVVRDGEEIFASTGDIVFHRPGEWHEIKADGKNVSNVAVVSFISHSRAMRFFEKKILKTGSRQREQISAIISEAGQLFETPLGDPFSESYVKRGDAPFGAEQLIKQYVCELLIGIIRDDINRFSNKTARNTASGLVGDILTYMEENISRKITLADLSALTNTGKTHIEASFREEMGMGAVEKFIKMKIDRAKRYIREDDYNITQIAEILGYDGIHYFSRQFKAVTGMSPTEYSKSIKAINEGGTKND